MRPITRRDVIQTYFLRALFAAVSLLGRDPSSLSLYDASLSEWAAADDLPMAP